MNRDDLQQLAELRVQDAQALLNAQQWSGAYYLAGYAVECALKACIAKLTSQHDFPDKHFINKCYNHELEKLVNLAGLEPQRKNDVLQNASLGVNWVVVKDWDEDRRYRTTSEIQARELYDAITHPKDGVLPWIQMYW